MNPKKIYTLLNRTSRWFVSALKSINVHKEQTGIFLNKANKPSVYYSPEVIKQLQKLAETYSPAPEGWMNSKKIYTLLNRTSDWFTSALKNITINQEQTGTFLNKRNRPSVYYSPKVIEQLQELAEKKK